MLLNLRFVGPCVLTLLIVWCGLQAGMFVVDVRSACSALMTACFALVTKLLERLVCTLPMLLASWAMGGFSTVSVASPKLDPEPTILDSESPHPPLGFAQRLAITLMAQKGTLAKTGVAFLASCAAAAARSQ